MSSLWKLFSQMLQYELFVKSGDIDWHYVFAYEMFGAHLIILLDCGFVAFLTVAYFVELYLFDCLWIGYAICAYPYTMMYYQI